MKYYCCKFYPCITSYMSTTSTGHPVRNAGKRRVAGFLRLRKKKLEA